VTLYEDRTSALTKTGNAIQFIYCATSLLLIADYKLSETFAAKGTVSDFTTGRISISGHAFMMMIMVFIYINPLSMSQTLTITRSLAFTLLSILWTYIVGVRNTVNAMHSREDCKVDRSALNSSHAYVQPIIHCHLRFGVVLVADIWYIAAWIPLALVLTLVRSYRSGLNEDTHQVNPDPYLDPTLVSVYLPSSIGCRNTVLSLTPKHLHRITTCTPRRPRTPSVGYSHFCRHAITHHATPTNPPHPRGNTRYFTAAATILYLHTTPRMTLRIIMKVTPLRCSRRH
jgi:hypothetical protein